MADEQKGVVAAGYSLLWRQQGVLWWIFVVNLVCGGLGTVPALLRLSHALNHSLSAEKLSKGFDLGMFVELLRLPDVSLMRYSTTSYIFAFVFFVFILFVTGGILETYRQDRRLNTGDFFAASGAFFWRFVRLMLLSIIPFVIVGMIYQALSKAADKIGDRAIADQVGIFLGWAAMLIFLLLALWVRLWFDIAQVRAVAQNERRMWRNLWKSWRITWHDLRRLFRIYVCISFVAWVTLAIGLVIWSKLPPTATLLTFLILELIVFAQLATRLWQLASATTWYQRHAEMVPAEPVIDTTPHPVEIVETTPSPALDLPPQDPGPVLPPVNA
ncbi:MAG: hypothetical protein ABSD98_08740 [Candidatus Korobacteraceae bacterium]|jgi:hypothetical protein